MSIARMRRANTLSCTRLRYTIRTFKVLTLRTYCLRNQRTHTCGDYKKAINLCRFLAGSIWNEFLIEQEKRTLCLIDLHWTDIKNVAATLEQRNKLTGRSVTRIIQRPIRLLEADRADKARWDRAEAEGFFDTPE
jgi:hypothetical protein